MLLLGFDEIYKINFSLVITHKIVAPLTAHLSRDYIGWFEACQQLHKHATVEDFLTMLDH